MMQVLLRQDSKRNLSPTYLNSNDFLKKALHLCWAENICDGVARKIFVFDWTPQIHNFLFSNIDTELGAEIHKLCNDIHPPCLTAGPEILLK